MHASIGSAFQRQSVGHNPLFGKTLYAQVCTDVSLVRSLQLSPDHEGIWMNCFLLLECQHAPLLRREVCIREDAFQVQYAR